ncbi:hypothetical protein MMPV_008515 [Pyropia vietnamensis]
MFGQVGGGRALTVLLIAVAATTVLLASRLPARGAGRAAAARDSFSAGVGGAAGVTRWDPRAFLRGWSPAPTPAPDDGPVPVADAAAAAAAAAIEVHTLRLPTDGEAPPPTRGCSAASVAGRPLFCRLHGACRYANGSLLLPAWMVGHRDILRSCGLPSATFTAVPAGRWVHGSRRRDLFLPYAGKPVRFHFPHFLSDFLLAAASLSAFPPTPHWMGSRSCTVASDVVRSCVGVPRGGLALALHAEERLLRRLDALSWVRGLLARAARGGVDTQLWTEADLRGAPPAPPATAGASATATPPPVDPLPICFRSILASPLAYGCVPPNLFPVDARLWTAAGIPRVPRVDVFAGRDEMAGVAGVLRRLQDASRAAAAAARGLPPPLPQPTASPPAAVGAAAAAHNTTVGGSPSSLAPFPVDAAPLRRRACTPQVLLLRRLDNRTFTNTEPLLAALARDGLSVRTESFEGATFDEQAAAMAATDILIGAHGAGLTNAALLRINSSLVEVFPFAFDAQPFKSLAPALSVRHEASFAAPRAAAFRACLASFAATAPAPDVECHARQVEEYDAAAAEWEAVAAAPAAPSGAVPGSAAAAAAAAAADDVSARRLAAARRWKLYTPTNECYRTFYCVREQSLEMDVHAVRAAVLRAADVACPLVG